MGVRVGSRTAKQIKTGQGELLGKYYYFEYSGSPNNAQLYIETATANGFSGGSLTCVEEFFNTLENIA